MTIPYKCTLNLTHYFSHNTNFSPCTDAPSMKERDLTTSTDKTPADFIKPRSSLAVRLSPVFFFFSVSSTCKCCEQEGNGNNHQYARSF